MSKNFLDVPSGLGRKVIYDDAMLVIDRSGSIYYKDNVSQVDKRLNPRDNDIVIMKTSSGAFCSSNIDLVLRSNNISRLVFVGGLTDGCVSSSLREAVDRGYLCTLVEDACITASQDDHDAVLRSLGKFYGWITSTKKLLENLS